MKNIVALLLTLVLVLGTMAVPVSAEEEPNPSQEYGNDDALYGDLDFDQAINAKDALLVLRFSVEKVQFTSLQQTLGDLNADGTIDAKDALLILQYAVEKITRFPVGEWYSPTPEQDDPSITPDGIPDKYQKQVVFQVVNGSWEDGSVEDIVCYVPLTLEGQWNELGSGSLPIPQGMIPFDGYSKGEWNQIPPPVVSGVEPQTFVYTFAKEEQIPVTPVEPSNRVGYLVEHYRLQENGMYPIDPTLVEFFTATVGEQVTAIPKSYQGYCLNEQISRTSGTLFSLSPQDTPLLLQLYYDADQNEDQIPDRYQKTVVFTVENGSWADGSTAPIQTIVTLTEDGVWQEQGSGELVVPTGMIPLEGYQGGAWLIQPPSTVLGNVTETFTYAFEPIPLVEEATYWVYHYLGTLDGGYESIPCFTESFTAPVGAFVTALAQNYEGYTLNQQVSALSGQVTKDGSLILSLYYDQDFVGGEEPEPEEPSVAESYIMEYDKSNSVNGAYEKDASADTSFVVDTTGLAPNTMYVVARTLGVDNVDYARLLFSLQGLINRDFGIDQDHTSLIYYNGGSVDAGWYDVVTQNGTIMQMMSPQTPGMNRVDIGNFESFYAYFGSVIHSCGIVLWDGNVPATANVAATICGLDGYLPVLADSPLHKTLVEKGVPVKQSLVGLFADGNKGQKITGTAIDSTGSAKNDAYLWALEKYFNRCSTQYIAYTPDGAVCVKGYEAYPDNPIALLDTASVNCLANHDYLIARRCFFFDLAPYKGEAACDDPAQKNGQAEIGTDNATMIRIYQARYTRANGEFGALMGFPPWWLKYTTFREMGSKEATWIEWLYCEYITCYNLAKEADAQAPAAMSNGSVYYKYIPKQREYTNNKTKQNLTFNKNTYYYTIYLGDYDSSAWLRQHIYSMWVENGGDSARGTLPLMWGINPNLSYRVPMIFDYLYENKTQNDYFVGGDGGAGYIIPAGLFHDKALSYTGEKRPSENAAAGDLFAAYSLPFYQRFNMDITGFLINGGNGNITKNIAACVNQYSPIGSFANASSIGIYKYNGTYYVNCYTGIGTSGAYETMYSFANGGMSSYFNKKNFGAYRTVCHTPSQVAANVEEFSAYASGKGMTVQYCDPYTYFDLLKQSGQGTTIR